MKTKRCSKCGANKPLKAFTKDRTKPENEFDTFVIKKRSDNDLPASEYNTKTSWEKNFDPIIFSLKKFDIQSIQKPIKS